MSEISQPTPATPAPAKPKLSPAKRRRLIKRIVKYALFIIVLVAAAIFGWQYYQSVQAKAAAASAPQYQRAQAQQGALDVNIYGSGSIAAANQPNVYVETDGKLAELRVSVGDSVSEGQIIAVLTNDDLNESIDSLEYALWSADKTVASTSAGKTVEAIVSPSYGRVMKVYAAKGDDALAVYRRLGQVAVLSTDGRMKVAVAVADGIQLTYGDVVVVTGDGFVAEGSITDVYLQGTQAIVTVVDDTLPMDAPVTVSTKAGQNIGSGTLVINKPMAVSAFGGTISKVRVKEGQIVTRNQTMFDLEDSPITLTVENLRIQRETAAEDLQAAREQRENLIVRAPVAGVIATVDVAEGDELTSGTLLCSILQGEDMVLTIAVDELDVVKVAEGQPVTISVDALPELALTGTVQKIAPVGTSSGGVSTYDVKLNFDATGTGVRPGMNASGQVQVAHADSAIYIPVEALQTINNQTYVLVADGGTGTAGGTGTVGGVNTGAAEDSNQFIMGSPDGGLPSFEGGQPPQMNGGEGGAAPVFNAQGGGSGNAGNGQRSGNAGGGQYRQRVTQSSGNTASTGTTSAANSLETTVSGTLRAVATGLVNDDYIEITSGLSAGETVLYLNSSTSSSSGNNMMMGGQNVRIMGF